MKKKQKKPGKGFLVLVSGLLAVNLVILTLPISSLALAGDGEGGVEPTSEETYEEPLPEEGEPENSSVTPGGETEDYVILGDAIDIASSSPEIIATSTPELLVTESGGDETLDDLEEESSGIVASDGADAGQTGVAEGDPLAINSDTGADSENLALVESENDTNITNNNIANTINNSNLRSITGSNDASFNTGSGIITTEKAVGKGGIINVINRNLVNVTGNPTGPINAGNENTGAYSDNTAEVNINNQLTIKNINDSNTVNQLTARVSSGNNKADKNSGHGIILTGDANLGLNFITMANTNLIGNQKFYADWQNIYGSHTGSIDLSAESAAPSNDLSDLLVNAFNCNTGPGSNNQVIVDVNDELTVSNENRGKINNHIDAEVISGRNSASSNTGSGSVTTGRVNSAINAVNFLNSNIVSSNWWLKSLNVFGDWNGDIRLPRMSAPNLSAADPATVISGNTATGANSENNAEVDIENNVTVDNQNIAQITNQANIITDTGNNITSYNGSSGVVKYGDVKAETNELNIANQNITGDSWWTVIVNKFGDWSGTTIGSPADIEVDSSDNSTILSPVGGGVAVENNSTGPLSNNDIGVSIDHSTDISNVNEADIVNTLDLKAISGQNQAEKNTGHGYIDAGNVRAVNNIINFANMNISVGNWLVTVVNVFGRWTGNLVFDNDLTSPTSGGSGSNTQAAINDGTGAGSDNSATSSNNSETNVTNNNTANTTNNSDVSSVSGENQASYNTGNGIVSTGGADTTSNIGNNINNNEVNVGPCPPGYIVADNSGTGAGSDNSTEAEVTCVLDANSDNNTNTNNNYTAQNSTGNNNSNYNTGNGIIDTGWAETYVDLYNEQNENQITIGEVIDDLDGGDVPGDDPGEEPGDGDNEVPGDIPGGNNGGGSSGGGGGYGPFGSFSGFVSAVKNFIFDLNEDGKVDEKDYMILFNNWKKTDINSKLDPNGDGIIDDYDLSIIMANWNRLITL